MMREVKRILMLITVVCLLVLTAGNVQAGYAWYTCTVVRTGQDDTGVYQITLARTGVTNPRTFTLPSDQTNRLLAVALSAMSANLKVRAYVDWSFGAGTDVKGLEAVRAEQ
jgi:hypothetical protein